MIVVLLSRTTGSLLVSDKKSNSFTERLVTKIIDNIQIVINKVHIRFEDEDEGKVFSSCDALSLLRSCVVSC